MAAATPRVVTYNVLSSSLSPPDYFNKCDPKDLDPRTRLPRVLEKLSGEVDKDAIICLQEVSMKWAGSMHAWFAQRGYHFVLHNYGPPFNGYMGVGIAFPTAAFEAVDTDLVRLSDTKRWPRAPKPSLGRKVVTAVTGPLAGLWRKVTGARRPDQPPFDYSRGRFNTLVQARLKCNKTGVEFCVATYHMPCAFWAPQVMTIHSALMIQCTQKWAAGAPLIVLGDMNIKPGDSSYRLITEGALAEDDENYPEVPAYDSWTPNVQYGMRSAYREAGGMEPDFTNFAQTKTMDEPFIDCLDYIFLSPTVSVKGVLPLPHRDAIQGPLPNPAEPSDHLMIAADLEVAAP